MPRQPGRPLGTIQQIPGGTVTVYSARHYVPPDQITAAAVHPGTVLDIAVTQTGPGADTVSGGPWSAQDTVGHLYHQAIATGADLEPRYPMNATTIRSGQTIRGQLLLATGDTPVSDLTISYANAEGAYCQWRTTP